MPPASAPCPLPAGVRARLALLLMGALILPLIAGCLDAGEHALDTGEDPFDATGDNLTRDLPASDREAPAETADDGGASDATNAPTDPAPPTFTLRIEDRRTDPLEPPRLLAVATSEAPPEVAGHLYFRWQIGSTEHNESALRTDNQTEWKTERTFTLPYGPHPVTLGLHWSTQDAAPTGPPHETAELDVVSWAPVRLVLNASERHASDQNAFHSDHWLPAATWNDASALDLLAQAADRHGFTLRTQYRADMDATFVDAINGTETRWDVQGAVSRNWMVLLDGDLSNAAADHTYPEPGATIEYRYVRCYATGSCDDLD